MPSAEYCTFIHLHVHSEYSLIDSLLSCQHLAKTVSSLNMPAVALTDHMNIFGAVKFFRACESVGIKPILGAEIVHASPSLHDTQPTLNELVLLCQNEIGYGHLRKLLTEAYKHRTGTEKPYIDTNALLSQNDGLIVLSGGRRGNIGRALLAEQFDKAIELATCWKAAYPNRFFIEINRLISNDPYDNLALSLAKTCQLPIIAAHTVCFAHENDFEAHEARTCISQGQILNDPKRPRLYQKNQYLSSAAEMQKRFQDLPTALQNTVEIGKRCNLSLQTGKIYLPDFPVPETLTLAEYLQTTAQTALEKKLSHLFPKSTQRETESPRYQARLAIELKVIIDMGFSGYFLIVADFIDWAKKNAVPVGPGRGSGAGSLVAYVLGITDIDPLRFDLLFERFLNPERVSMPDFDIDFCMQGRDRVIEYVAKRYGKNNVSQIITFGTMAAKAVIRDVGRVSGHPYGFVDTLAKLIPFDLGITLEKALEQEDKLRERYLTEPAVTELINLAKKLEGLSRNVGKHAGGVVIAPSALTDFTALFYEKAGDIPVTQFDKDDIESIGLIKFDFLGLKTLTVIDWTLQYIQKSQNKQIDITALALEDPTTFQLLQSAETTAVFQLESRGMKDLIKRLQPDCFEDVIALVALFRPGPLQSGMVDDFINRKHGREAVSYLHPLLKEILQTTYGVILYQEQVMQIAQALSGYSLGQADLLRRAMGKKKPEEMAKQRAIFLAGAEKQSIDPGLANNIFDLMEKFAGYGFNKSHSAAYALLSYQTAWLKSHYTIEFMAAALSADMENTDKISTLFEECKKFNITVLPPDINASDYYFQVQSAQLRYGLGAIKGLGKQAIQQIVQARAETGHFLNLFDFSARIPSKVLNRRGMEALIKAGAFDGWKIERGKLLANVDTALQYAEQEANSQRTGQLDLFTQINAKQYPSYAEAKALPALEKLHAEKATLGIYFSGHPITLYTKEIRQYISHAIKDLSMRIHQARIIGLITDCKYITTKRGKKMAVITITDQSAKIEVTLFSDLFEQHKDWLTTDIIIACEGEIESDPYQGGIRIRAQQLYTLTQLREKKVDCIKLTLNKAKINTNKLTQIKTLLQSQPGKIAVIANYQDEATGQSTTVQLAQKISLQHWDQIAENLAFILEEDDVAFPVYTRDTSTCLFMT